jgi:hypothetical protein
MAQWAARYRSRVRGDLPRPWLDLYVTRSEAGWVGPITGLVDSGSDATVLPFKFAGLMGYTPDTLAAETIMHAGGGTATSFRALRPCTMVVPETPRHPVEMRPLFVEGARMALWGRRDFMTAFDVTIREAAQQFVLEPHP